MIAAAGYRADRTNHHDRVIHSLEFAVGADAAAVRKLDLFRKKRNTSDYEMAGAISEDEATARREYAQALRGSVLAWLRKHHPRLTP